jgi:hypothetical protein
MTRIAMAPSSPHAGATSTPPLLSMANAEESFSKDFGCYTPPPSPTAASAAMPSRRSGRHAVAEDGSAATDKDSLRKAMRRKALMNLDGVGTSGLSKSYISFSTPVISSKLNSIGIKLGKNLNEINFSSNILRHMEFDSITVGPKLLNAVDNTDLDDEEANATMDGQLISSLVSIVSEGDLNEAMLGSLYELQASSRKSKSSSNKKPKKRLSLQNPLLCHNEWYIYE